MAEEGESLNDSQDIYADLYNVDLRNVRSGTHAEPVLALGGVESTSANTSSSSSSHQPNEPVTPRGWVYASNMTWWSTDQELEELLSPYVRVLEITFEENKETGKSKGAAWISLSDYEQAVEACRHLRGTFLHNQAVEFSAHSASSRSSSSWAPVPHGSSSSSSSSTTSSSSSSSSSSRRQIRPSIEHNKRQNQQQQHHQPYPPRHGRHPSDSAYERSPIHDRSPSSSPSSNDYPHSYSHPHSHSHSHTHSSHAYPHPHSSYSHNNNSHNQQPHAPPHSSHLRPREYSRYRDDRDDRHHRYRESPPRR